MTYNEFMNGEHIRPISGFNGEYLITNKGRVFSTKTQQFIGLKNVETASVALYKNGKTYRYSVAKLLLETFPDVEFDASLIQSLVGNGRKSSTKPRGVYLNPNYVENLSSSFHTKEQRDFILNLKNAGLKYKEILPIFNSTFDKTFKNVHSMCHILRGNLKTSSPKYRAVISFKNTKISLGYAQTIEEAQDLYYMAFLKLKGYRPWD